MVWGLSLGYGRYYSNRRTTTEYPCKGVVTQQMFSARADKIPADIREPTLRNGNRLRDVINGMLLRAQLAADAREAGFDQNQVVIDRMKLAAEYVNSVLPGVLEALALIDRSMLALMKLA